jgi:carbonic anhydrase
VSWVLLAATLEMSDPQIKKLKQLFEHNSPSLQPVNGRNVSRYAIN